MFRDFDPAFVEPRDVHQFKAMFTAKIVAHFEAGWSFFDEGSDRPIGIALANVPPHSRRVVLLQEVYWYPWASTRAIRAAFAQFMLGLHRSGLVVLEFSREKDEHFFDALQRDGVARKVGQVREMYDEAQAVLYQSWSPTARRSK